MRKSILILHCTSAAIAALAAAPALYAQATSPDSQKKPGTMQHDDKGMMGMMQQMGPMMEHCNNMMKSMRDAQESTKPEERKPAPGG